MNTTIDTTRKVTDATGYKRHPKDLKARLAVIAKAARLHQWQLSLSGIVGGETRVSMTATMLGLSDEVTSPKAREAFEAIASDYDWTVTRDNVAMFAAKCYALVQKAQDPDSGLLSVDDMRRTPESIRADNERHAQQGAERKAKEAREAEEAAQRERAATAQLQDLKAPEGIPMGEVAGCPGLSVPLFVARRPDLDHSAQSVWPYGCLSTAGANHGEVCKLIRERIAEAQAAGLIMPCKVSVRKRWATHSAAIDISITATPDTPESPEWLQAEAEGRTKAERYDTLPDEYRPEVRAALAAIEAIAHMYHWDKSDSYSDYFHSRFYLDVRVGYECEGNWTPPKRMLPRKGAPASASAPVASAPVTGAAPSGVAPSGAGAYTVTGGQTKRGTPIVIVTPTERVEKDEHARRKAWVADRRGWYYSRAMLGNPAGFAFRISEDGEANAAEFCRLFLGDGDPGPDGAPQAKADASTQTATQYRDAKASEVTAQACAAKAAKIRAMADKLDEQAAGKLAPRMENTAKRQAQAASARIDGERMQRAAHYLRAWADAAEAGTLPPELLKAPTKAEAIEAAKKPLDHTANGYHPIAWESTDPEAWHYTEPRHVALRALVEVDHAQAEANAEANAKAAAKAQALASLRNSQIPGFFPTPDSVADQMAEAAQLEPGDMVGDSGAGIGSLLLAAMRAQPELAGCVGYEINPTLAAYLSEHVASAAVLTACEDSLRMVPTPVDVVLINPPYENDAALAHVRKACDWCKRRVVALVPAQLAQWDEDHANGRQQSRTSRREFTEWLDGVQHYWIDVDPDAFKSRDAFRQAGVATAILVIEKD